MTARRSDLVARLGGDEFLVLMPDTPLSRAMARIDALRERIAAQGLGLVDSEGRVTLEAKRAGRNRVVGPPPEEPPCCADRTAPPRPG